MNVKALEENGYQFRDFSEELLPIIPEDCRLVILPELYGSYCNLFIEISCTNSQSLQLKIENLFNDNNNLYAEYLPNHLLKRFCLANLIRLNTYTPLESYYLSGTCISLSQEEKELILKNISDQL